MVYLKNFNVEYNRTPLRLSSVKKRTHSPASFALHGSIYVTFLQRSQMEINRADINNIPTVSIRLDANTRQGTVGRLHIGII